MGLGSSPEPPRLWGTPPPLNRAHGRRRRRQLSFEWGWGTPLFTVLLCDLQKCGRVHPVVDQAPAGLQQAR